MNHQHFQIQRSYPGFSRGCICVGLLPMMLVLLKRMNGICFEQDLNSDDEYIRPWCYETQVQ